MTDYPPKPKDPEATIREHLRADYPDLIEVVDLTDAEIEERASQYADNLIIYPRRTLELAASFSVQIPDDIMKALQGIVYEHAQGVAAGFLRTMREGAQAHYERARIEEELSQLGLTD